MDNNLSIRVNKRYVEEAIVEYHKSISSLNGLTSQHPTIEINGSMYYAVDMSSEELFKLKDATDMNDFQWT